MTTILLVRHAVYDGLGSRLGGRLDGLRLSAEGKAQAARLAAKLKTEAIGLLLSSPRERCLETADAIASHARVAPEICGDLDEVDFGAWSGRRFDELAEEAGWRFWNAQRSLASTPAGETMLDVQRRFLRAVARASSLRPRGTAVLVSHAEPIRAGIFHWLGISLDSWSKLEIAPASVSRLTLDESGARVGSVNEPGA